MAKKAKKLINKVKKFTEKADPFGAGLLNPYMDGMSDQFLGTDNLGLKAEQAAMQRQQQELLANLNATLDSNGKQLSASQMNANVDLALDNVPDTEIGGTANAQSTNALTAKKKKPVGGVASQLGLNV